MELQKFNAVFTANKKEIVQMATSNAEIIFSEGNTNLATEYCKARRINEYLTAYCDNLKPKVKDLLSQNGNKLGVQNDELQVTNGRVMYDYTTDQKYWELEKKLKARKELLDFAIKSSEQVFDSDGELVEKCPVKSYGEDVLTLRIK